jgi:REP element-mobilizing transposase RayT
VHHRLYVHIVWTTRRREPTLDAASAVFLAGFLPAVASQERSRLLAFGAVRTHVHLLVQLHPTTSLPRLVQRLKGGSSVISNREGHGRSALRWAKGYSVASVGERALEAARRYVASQAEHHPGEAIAGWDGWGASAAFAAEPSRGFSRGSHEAHESRE